MGFSPARKITNEYSFRLLKVLPDTAIWKYGTHFHISDHDIALHWQTKRVFNVDLQMLFEFDIILLIIQECVNLEKINVQSYKYYSDEVFEKFCGSVAKYCPKIEVLDMRGLVVEDLEEMSGITSLKTLSINITNSYGDEPLGDVFGSNPNLESVTIFNNNNSNLAGTCFRRLPKTVKKLELQWFSENTALNFNTLLESVQELTLEELTLTNLVLHSGHIATLSKCTTFKLLNIATTAEDASLMELFKSNPALEELALYGVATIEGRPEIGVCFRYLPQTMKSLFIGGDFNVSQTEMLISLETLKMEILSFPECFSQNLNFISDLVETVPELKDLRIGIEHSEKLFELWKLKNLVNLSLYRIPEIRTLVMECIANNCLNLKCLMIYYPGITPSSSCWENISKLPQLETFSVFGLKEVELIDFQKSISNLSQSKSLKWFRIEDSSNFDNDSALLLIEKCATLCYLDVMDCAVSPDLIRQAGKVLEQQEERSQLLEMDLKFIQTKLDRVPKFKPHPLLKYLITT